MKGLWRGILVVNFIVLLAGGSSWAQETTPPMAVASLSEQDVQGVIDADLKERTKRSGTLDIFDDTIKKVRNLRKMEFQKGIQKDGNSLMVLANYRDINSGAVVEMAFILEQREGKAQVKDLKINKVTELPSATTASGTPKDYTDAEIQSFMHNYVVSQQRFSGSMMIFDEENNKPRNLQLVKLQEQVKRFGKLYISRANFKDIDSADVIGVDITVENNNGTLQVQSTRIREIQKSASPAGQK